MKKILIIIFVLPNLFFSLYGQMRDQLNHDRYWWYRFRLRNDFMRDGFGEGSTLHGYYIPAGERGDQGAHNILKGGDGVIELGWYIATLATEYKLLVRSGESTQNTVASLYGAINTFNRLDFYAETYYKDGNGDPGVPALNGFFIRDDIEDDSFLWGDNDPLTVGLASKNFRMDHVDFSLSSALANNEPPRPGGADQIWYLMMGFRLVKEYVPEGIHYEDRVTHAARPFWDGETDILKEVQNITERIITHLSQHSWHVYNPVTESNVDNEDGGNAQTHSYGAALVADIISPDHATDHHDFITQTIGLPAWFNLSGTGWAPQIPCVTGGPSGATDNDKFLLLAVLGNSWPASVVALRAEDEGYEYQVLLARALNGYPGTPISQTLHENLFQSAPCVGPYRYYEYDPSGNGNIIADHYPTNEWSSRSRFVHPEARHDYPCTPALQFQGEYNGLDYMLFHNLYYIVHNSYSVVNEDFRHDDDNTYPHPHPFPGVPDEGSLSSPATIVGFHSLGSDGTTLNQYSDVTYHAGYSMVISNFQSGADCKFHAYIKPFECATTLDEYRDTPATNEDDENGVHPLVQTAQMLYENKPIVSDVMPAFVQTSAPMVKAPVAKEKPVHVSVFPNPSIDGKYIISFLAVGSQQKKIGIYDALGNKLKEEIVFSNDYNLNIGDLAKGIYLVKIESADGVYTQKIVYQ